MQMWVLLPFYGYYGSLMDTWEEPNWPSSECMQRGEAGVGEDGISLESESKSLSSSSSSSSLLPPPFLLFLLLLLVQGFHFLTQRLRFRAVSSPCPYPVLLGSNDMGSSLLEFHNVPLSPWVWSQTLRAVSWPSLCYLIRQLMCMCISFHIWTWR